jgi:GT2 family glycosyltransferase
LLADADVEVSRETGVAIDVVVLTWNDGPMAEAAVRSALDSDGVRSEVVVVDNGSEPRFSLDLPRVSVVRNDRNRGVAAARNQGARLGHADFLCFLDSDAVLLPDTLALLAAPMLAEPAIALSAPVFLDQDPSASAGRAPSFLDKARRVLGRSDRYRSMHAPGVGTWEVDFAIGACQLIRRSRFEEVGGLDERYFYGPEDVDFCLRLIEAGHRVVQVAGARCHHPARRLHRRPFNAAGLRHARAVALHLWRHRSFRRSHPLDRRRSG